MIPYTQTSTSIVVLLQGKPYTVDKSHANFQKIVEAIHNDKSDEVLKFIDVSSTITAYGEGNITIKDGVILCKGDEVHNYIVDKIFEFIKEELPVKHLLLFLDKLLQNPSYRSVEQAYRFLEYGRLPITEDGCFMAYKKVRGNYKDIHSGTFDNSVGAICEMPRNKVNEDPNITCSSGLHICSWEYLDHFGSSSDNRVVLVKVDPKDLVSVPTDYQNTKCRVSRYEVIQDVTEQYYGKRNVLSETALYAEPSKLKAIHQYAEDGSLIGMYADAPTAEKASGIWSQNILKCTRGERMSAGGFTWELK